MVYRVTEGLRPLSEFVWFGVFIGLVNGAGPVLLSLANRQPIKDYDWGMLLLMPAFSTALFWAGWWIRKSLSRPRVSDVQQQVVEEAVSISTSKGDWAAQVWLAQNHGVDDGLSLWLIRSLRGEAIPNYVKVELVSA